MNHDNAVRLEEWTAIALDDLRAQLDANPALTPPQRIAALAFFEPIIRVGTAAALVAGWRDLQSDAATPQTIH